MQEPGEHEQEVMNEQATYRNEPSEYAATAALWAIASQLAALRDYLERRALLG